MMRLQYYNGKARRRRGTSELRVRCKMPRCTLGIRSSTPIAYVLGAIVDRGREMRGRGATERRREIDVNKTRGSLRPTLGHGRFPRVRLGRRAARPSWSIPRLRGRRGRLRSRRGKRVLPAVARPGPLLRRVSPGPGGSAPGLARRLGGAAQRSKCLSGQRRRRGRRGGHLGEAGLRVVHS